MIVEEENKQHAIDDEIMIDSENFDEPECADEILYDPSEYQRVETKQQVPNFTQPKTQTKDHKFISTQKQETKVLKPMHWNQYSSS